MSLKLTEEQISKMDKKSLYTRAKKQKSKGKVPLSKMNKEQLKKYILRSQREHDMDMRKVKKITFGKVKKFYLSKKEKEDKKKTFKEIKKRVPKNKKAGLKLSSANPEEARKNALKLSKRIKK